MAAKDAALKELEVIPVPMAELDDEAKIRDI
jgi:hypothetical protein